MRARRVLSVVVCTLVAACNLTGPVARVSAVGVSTPTFTPVSSQPTPTVAPATPLPPTPRPTGTTAPVPTNTLTFTPVPSATPTTPPPATPTFTFTPLVPKPTTSVLGTPTPVPTNPPLLPTVVPALATSTPAPTAVPPTATQPAPTSTLPAVTSTPIAPTSTAPPSGAVVINELLIHAQDIDWDASGNPKQAQWVELYNPTDSDVSLVNWSITNGSHASDFRFQIGTVIAAHQYLVRFRKDLDLDLSLGQISLLDPSRNAIDTVLPPRLEPDQSYARLPDGANTWIISSSPTLNGPNVLPPDPAATPDLQATVLAIRTQVAQPLPSAPSLAELDDGSLEDAELTGASRRPRASRTPRPFQSLPIADIRGLPDESPVAATGVVTMPTGLWDLDRAYIQSAGAGILIHSFGGAAVHLGDLLTIKGRVHHVGGEVEIAAVKGGEQASAGGSLPAARQIQPGAVGAGSEALLVQISGHVEAAEPNYVVVADDAGSARVFVYNRLNVSASVFKAGESIAVTGVVNAAESSPAGPPRGTYAQRVLGASHRLVPRAMGDILVEGLPLASEQPSNQGQPSRPVRARDGRPESAVERSGGVGGAASIEPAPGAGASPRATPVLSGRRPAPLQGPASSSGSILTLDGLGSSSPPAWLWLALGIGVGLLAGCAAFVLGPIVHRKVLGKADQSSPGQSDDPVE